MHIVLGASGRVGSEVVKHLLSANQRVRAVVHSDGKGDDLRQQGADVVVADSFDKNALQAAFQGGTTAFVLTPETGKSEDVLGETQTILANYRAAVESTSVQKVVGLSSMGAQFPVGNLKMSYRLERAFKGVDVQAVFVRPGYYLSNWLLYTDTVRETGVLPTFYPADLPLPMVAPQDVGDFLADVLVKDQNGDAIYELEGPAWYSSNDVAAAFAAVLGRDVKARQIPREQWADTLGKAGFTEDATQNFIAMTEIIAAGNTQPEGNGTIAAKTTTPLKEYLTKTLANS